MPGKPMRYQVWFAAFVVATVGLRLTSSNSIVRAPDNNSNGAPSDTASAAGADSNSHASPAEAPPVFGDHSSSGAATAAAVNVVLHPAVDQAIYYWAGRARGFVRSYWSGPSGMAEARLN